VVPAFSLGLGSCTDLSLCVTLHKLILWCALQFSRLNLVIIPTEVLIRSRKIIFISFMRGKHTDLADGL
jgi:hypothetical protein